MGRIIIGIGKNSGVVFLLFLLLLVVGGTSPLQAAEPIKIGAVLGITGFISGFGTPEMEAITIAMERVNREGGVLGRKVEVYFEDDQSVPTNTPIAATKLIRDKKVCCVIGSSLTVCCMSMLPIFEAEQVPNVSLGAGREITFPIKKWVFMIPLPDIKITARMVKYAVNSLGAKRIALLHDTGASGVMAANGIVEDAPKYGASIIITEKFDPRDTNMIPQLTNVKAASPDLMILYTTPPAAAVVAKNYHQLGIKIPVLAANSVLMQDFMKIAGKIAEEGHWISFAQRIAYPYNISPDDPFRKNIFDPFMKDLKERYGKEKEFHVCHGLGHDAFQLVLNALKIAGTNDRAALRDAMERVSFEGFACTYNFSSSDHCGQDAEKSFVPVIVRDGGIWPYKK